MRSTSECDAALPFNLRLYTSAHGIVLNLHRHTMLSSSTTRVVRMGGVVEVLTFGVCWSRSKVAFDVVLSAGVHVMVRNW